MNDRVVVVVVVVVGVVVVPDSIERSYHSILLFGSSCLCMKRVALFCMHGCTVC